MKFRLIWTNRPLALGHGNLLSIDCYPAVWTVVASFDEYDCDHKHYHCANAARFTS